MNEAIQDYTSAILKKYGVPDGTEGWDAGYDAIVSAFMVNPATEVPRLVSVGVFAVRNWLRRRRQTASLDHHGGNCPGLESVETADFVATLTEGEKRVFDGESASLEDTASFYTKARRELR